MPEIFVSSWTVIKIIGNGTLATSQIQISFSLTSVQWIILHQRLSLLKNDNGSVVFEPQFKNYLTSWKSHVSFLRYSVFHIFNHWINFESCDAMINISTWGRALEYIFWIVDHFNIQLGQLIDIVIGNIFRKHSVWFGKQGPKSKPFLITNQL